MRVRVRTSALVLISAVLLSACGDKATGPSLAGGHTPFPLITNRGGPVLSPMRLVVIVAANDDQRDSLFMFADALLASSWWQQVSSAYGVVAQPSAVHVLGPTLVGTSLPPTQQQTYITSAIADSAALAPDGRTLYLLYLPAGVTYSGNENCQGYIGYHSYFPNSAAPYAVVQRCQQIFQSLLEELTVIGSHEVIEAATDPLGNAWGLPYLSVDPWTTTPWVTLDPPGEEENGDFCIGTRYREGAFYYQRVYANAAVNAGGDPCIPALGVPYYNLTTPQTWYSALGSSTIQIPVTGWSTDTTTDWLVNTFVAEQSSSNGIPALSLTGATDSTLVDGEYLYPMNSGRALTLHVTMPAGSAGDSWATIKLHSFRLDANGLRPPPGEDYSHFWVVGVRVVFGADAVHR